MSELNLIKIQHFFEADIKIKKEIYSIMPPTDNDFIDKKTICKYTDNLDDSLQYIFSELKSITLDIFGKKSLFFKRIKELEKEIKKAYYSCGLDINKLRKFYKIYITNMESTFINEVKSTCVGYSIFNNPPVDMANTINEFLHLMHSYILNNENILQSIPSIAQKTNNYDYQITLRGISTPFFNQLFKLFPNDLNIGWTDIVCLSDKKSLIMIRDIGHASTIEITLNNNIARLEYFIPKICNIDMVNKLQGINKVNENSVGATGVIETEINNLPTVLFDFISKVPTDEDIIYESKNR